MSRLEKFSSQIGKLAESNFQQIQGGSGSSTDTSKCTITYVGTTGSSVGDTDRDGDYYPDC